MTAGPTDPPSLPSALFVWRSGRGGLYRLVAHVLIRLLILLPLPPQLQMGALLFPVSLLWPLVTAQPAEAVKEGPAETTAEVLLARSFPLSDGLCGVSPRRWDLVLALRTDIVMSGNTAIVAIGGGKAELVDLTTPSNPRVTGELSSGIGTRLALTGSNLLVSTYRTYLANMNNPLQGLHVATLGEIPVLTVEPKYALINQEEKTQNDVKLRYRVVPNVGQVQSIRIELKDENGVLLSSFEPAVSSSGEVVWPKGQSISATPETVVFEVRNSDGSTSNTFAAGGTVSAVLPPELISVSPPRAVVGGAALEITLVGRNFLPACQVQLSRPGEAPVTLPARYTSSTTLKATMPAERMGALGVWAVTVTSGSASSNAIPFKIVRAGLTPAPTVSAVVPSQIVAGSTGLWVTVSGQGFVSDVHQVYVSGVGSPLLTTYHSATELHALVGADFLEQPGSLTIRVGSLEDADLVSEGRKIEVVTAIGAPAVAAMTAGPQITGTDPPVVPQPYVQPGGEPTRVRVLGRGFQSGAQVFARIDGGDPVSLPTQVMSENQVEATLSQARWGQRTVNATLVIETPTGPRETVKLVRREQPTVRVKRNRHPRNPERGAAAEVTFLEPSRFYDPTAGYVLPSGGSWPWLLEPMGYYKGRPLSYGLDENPLGFEVEVADRSEPVFYDGTNVALRVETTGPGFGGDTIPSPVMTAYPGEVTRFRSKRMGVVMDEVDDGSIQGDAGGNQISFSEKDGQAEDQTIRGKLGGKLKVNYKNHADGKQIDLEQEIEICPQHLRRKVFLNPVLLSAVQCGAAGDPQPCYSVDEIGTFVQHAGEIWAQACVEIEAKPVRTITSAPPALIDPSTPIASWRFTTPWGFTYHTYAYMFPTALRTALAADNNAYPKARHEINVYFVRSLTDGAAIGFDGGGHLVNQLPVAGPPAPGDEPAMTALAYPFTNTIFMSTTKSGGQRQVNARTLAHELAHVVLHMTDSQEPGDVSLTLSGTVPPNSLLRKRFTDHGVQVIRDPQNPVVCAVGGCP